MHVDVSERDLARELEPHHHHAGDPEEDDLARRRQEVGRIEGAQLRRVVGPAERREGPQRRGEPGVEDVLVLARRGVAVGTTLGLRLGDDDLAAFVAVPDRQPVSPPQLARDAPRPDVAHPVEIDALPLLGDDPHLVALDDLDRRLRELVHAAEPLQGDQRLDALAGAVREGHRVRVLPLAADPALIAQGGDDRLPGIGDAETGEALARVFGHAPVLADDGDLVEAVAAAHLEVVDVGARSDLEGAGAELGVDVVVGDDRQPATDDRQDRVLADEARVAFVIGVHRDGGVGEHRLGAHGRDGDHLVGSLDRVFDLVERVGDLAVLDLEVGDRRPRAGVPVDHVVVAVDVALLVQRHEHPVQRRARIARRA